MLVYLFVSVIFWCRVILVFLVSGGSVGSFVVELLVRFVIVNRNGVLGMGLGLRGSLLNLGFRFFVGW